MVTVSLQTFGDLLRRYWLAAGLMQEELALLDHVLIDGSPILLVAGELGIGKSRLLQAGTEGVEAHGWTVQTGGCHRRGYLTQDDITHVP